MKIILGSILLVSYFYNVMWLVDNWATISWVYKAFEVFSVFAVPLGSVMGIIHFI